MKQRLIKALATGAVLVALTVTFALVAGLIRRFDLPDWGDVLAMLAPIAFTFMSYRAVCNTKFGRQYLYDLFNRVGGHEI